VGINGAGPLGPRRDLAVIAGRDHTLMLQQTEVFDEFIAPHFILVRIRKKHFQGLLGLD